MRYIFAQDPARVRGRWLNRLAAHIGRIGRIPGLISVAFVSPAEMERLNTLYRGKSKPTDVLSFPFLDAQGSRQRKTATRPASSQQKQIAGEIIFCLPMVRVRARMQGHTLRDELKALLVHASLHILGYDHANDKEAKVMEKLEEGLLARSGSRLAKR